MAMVITYYPKSVPTEEATNVTESLADYLISVGY